MKVLVATSETQGTRDGDFSRTVGGELVFDGGPCDRARAISDWSCECAVAFIGVASGEMTTTAIVADLPIDIKTYQRAFRDGLGRRDICKDCARIYSHQARMLAVRWPIGTVVERRWDQFIVRMVGVSDDG